MRRLHLTSYALTALGLVLTGLGFALDLGATVQLSGIMLTLAGVVKILVVYLWMHVAGLGTDRHDPIRPN